MGLKKTVKKTVRAVSKVSGSSPLGWATKIGGVLLDRDGVKKANKGKRRQSVAKIKRKIALLKAKKELAKVRGY